ncbi:MAG: hypothetical protein ACFE8V_14615 [Promethearchaeota archaeon]
MSEEDPVEELEKLVEEEKEKKAKPRTTPTKKKKTSKAKKKTTTTKAMEPEVKAPEQIVFKKLLVNFWRTRLHDEEIGIHQQLKYQAKTRWFSKNFDIEGVIEEDDEKKYIIAFNKDQWQEDPLEKKRLVCRFFTIMEESMDSAPKGGNFKGGLELSIAHSLAQSYEIKRPAPVFIMQIPGTINLVRLVRSWRLVGTRWSFPLLPEDKEDEFQIVRARGVVGPGRNYKIYIGKKLIARVDGHPIQKESEIEIYDEDYAKDKTFRTYMILFGCACNFMDDATKLVKRHYKMMKNTGSSPYKPPKNELDLYRNPRMMRR